MKKLERFLIVEDEPLIAEDIEGYLRENGYHQIEKVYEAQKALDLLEEKEFDFILLDIDLGGKLTGIDIAQKINTQQQVPFAFITSFSDKRTIEKVKKTFPVGYIVKPFKSSDIYTCIEIGFSNFYEKSVKPLKFTIEIINSHIPTPLSIKEFEVLLKMSEGLTNIEIATALFVSLNTTKTHLKNIFVKLNVNSRTEAVHFITQF